MDSGAATLLSVGSHYVSLTADSFPQSSPNFGHLDVCISAGRERRAPEPCGRSAAAKQSDIIPTDGEVGLNRAVKPKLAVGRNAAVMSGQHG